MINTSGEYKPNYKINSCDKDDTGTTIILTNLKRKSGFDKKGLATSLSKLFNFSDENFTIKLSLNDDEPIIVDKRQRYEAFKKEFEWTFPSFSNTVEDEYEYKGEISGKIITTKKPLPADMRGITLFANGRMINASEFFGAKESSHFYSYATGWLDVDFVDLWDEDVISTDRQSINWELDKTESLRNFLKKCIYKIEREWREKRKERKRREIEREISEKKGEEFEIEKMEGYTFETNRSRHRSYCQLNNRRPCS